MIAGLKNKTHSSCIEMAREFAELYYRTFDTGRHEIARLFSDGAIFTWNGKGTSGPDQIQKFIIELPESEHEIVSVQAQPVADEAIGQPSTHLIHVVGKANYYIDWPTQHFQQSFLIAAQGDVWKIHSDCYRMQDYRFYYR